MRLGAYAGRRPFATALLAWALVVFPCTLAAALLGSAVPELVALAEAVGAFALGVAAAGEKLLELVAHAEPPRAAASKSPTVWTARLEDPGPGQCPVCAMEDVKERAERDEVFELDASRCAIVPYGDHRAHWDCAELVPYRAPTPPPWAGFTAPWAPLDLPSVREAGGPVALARSAPAGAVRLLLNGQIDPGWYRAERAGWRTYTNSRSAGLSFYFCDPPRWVYLRVAGCRDHHSAELSVALPQQIGAGTVLEPVGAPWRTVPVVHGGFGSRYTLSLSCSSCGLVSYLARYEEYTEQASAHGKDCDDHVRVEHNRVAEPTALSFARWGGLGY